MTFTLFQVFYNMHPNIGYAKDTFSPRLTTEIDVDAADYQPEAV